MCPGQFPPIIYSVQCDNRCGLNKFAILVSFSSKFCPSLSMSESTPVAGKSHHGRGFSLFTATVFIIGEVAGGGILSLPHATAQAGWSGLAMIVYCASCAAISGLCLAESWIILEERYPQYREGLTRKPYATIGLHAYGRYMSVLVSILININLIGAAAIFLLLTSGLISSLTQTFINISFCQWIPIVAAVILIPLWLGSPADFWPIAYSAMISTSIGSILLIVNTIMQISKNGTSNDFDFDGLESFSTAFGTILFAFGGASAFPNFQNDMRQKEKFPKAVIFGFIGLLILYLPTAGLGYAAFGSQVQSSIIDDLPSGPIITIVKVCFMVHCFAVVFIVFNPVYLDLEELLRIPKEFNWKRCLFRTTLLLFVLFIGETFPSFGQILNLIGGSTVTLLAFVLPPIFYVKLCLDRSDPEWPKRTIPNYMSAVFVVIVITGAVGGFASTYSTLKQWQPLKSACYVSHASNITV